MVMVCMINIKIVELLSKRIAFGLNKKHKKTPKITFRSFFISVNSVSILLQQECLVFGLFP